MWELRGPIPGIPGYCLKARSARKRRNLGGLEILWFSVVFWQVVCFCGVGLLENSMCFGQVVLSFGGGVCVSGWFLRAPCEKTRIGFLGSNLQPLLGTEGHFEGCLYPAGPSLQTGSHIIPAYPSLTFVKMRQGVFLPK